MEKAQFVIGELARRTGYSAAMIRYLEKLRVITPSVRAAAGYRLLGPHHVQELRFAREMQDLGFYAQQIKALRDIKLSQKSAAEKIEAINEVFQDHVKYTEDKALHFRRLKLKLDVAATGFVDQVLRGDC